jgi:hypothetical protein
MCGVGQFLSNKSGVARLTSLHPVRVMTTLRSSLRIPNSHPFTHRTISRWLGLVVKHEPVRRRATLDRQHGDEKSQKLRRDAIWPSEISLMALDSAPARLSGIDELDVRWRDTTDGNHRRFCATSDDSITVRRAGDSPDITAGRSRNTIVGIKIVPAVYPPNTRHDDAKTIGGVVVGGHSCSPGTN